jgi:solute carrier family 7 (cationic amino acid transporter), member 3
VPRSGSAYVYIYVTIGEFAAFLMGWDLILEYIIGSLLKKTYQYFLRMQKYKLILILLEGIAGVASALSQNVDLLFNREMREYLIVNVPLRIPGLGPYPDFLAFLVCCIGIVLMLIGIKESGHLNKIFAVFYVIFLSFIIVIGATRANFYNWNLTPNVKLVF